MSTEVTTKFQNALWWIASIAVSVLCCSILFILFASYLVEVKADVRDNNIRLTTVEQQEDRILSELEAVRKHETAEAQIPAVNTPSGDTSQTVQPPVIGDAHPTTEAPSPTVSAPTPAAPPINVPSISTPSENK